jgi:hypothetical protein
LHAKNQVRVAVVHPEDPAVRQEITDLATKLGASVEFTVVSPSSLRFLLVSYAKLEQEEKDRAQEAVLQQPLMKKRTILPK